MRQLEGHIERTYPLLRLTFIKPGFKSTGYAMQQTGCANSSFGCMLPLLLIIILVMVGLIGGC